MRRVIAIITIAFSLALLAGCAGKKNEAQTPEKTVASGEAQTEQNTAVPQSGENLKELSFELVASNEHETIQFHSDNVQQWDFRLSEYNNVVLKFGSRIALSDLKEHFSGELDLDKLFENSIPKYATYQITIDASELKESKRIIIHKGLENNLHTQALKADIVVDFSAPPWNVQVQRVDTKTREELINNLNVLPPDITVRLSFDLPADRASVEQSIKKNILDYSPYDTKSKKPEHTEYRFIWESDTLCYVTVLNLEVGGSYKLDLSEAKAQNGSTIYELQTDSGHIGYFSFPKSSTPEERRNNIVYFFKCRKPLRFLSLSLKNGAVRELGMINDAFASVGPVSPSGRYVVLSPFMYSWDWLGYTYNLAVYDRETGTMNYDETLYGDYSDEVSVDNAGKGYTNGSKRDSQTGMTFAFAEQTWDCKTLQIKSKDGKVQGSLELKERTYNTWWLKGGLIAYCVREWIDNKSQPVLYIHNIEGELVNTMTGFMLLSVSPDGSVTALEKDNVIELYNTDWKKIGELDMKKLGANVPDENGPVEFRQLVQLFWGKDELCLYYRIGEYSENPNRAVCRWNYRTGISAVMPIPDEVKSLVSLYFDSTIGEMLFAPSHWQMRYSYTFVP